MDTKRVLLIAVALLIFFFSHAGISLAVHRGAGDLVCGQCHTMHNSQGGQGLGGASGGSLLLLNANVNSRAEISRFCLQCHGIGGSMAGNTFQPHGQPAPKVYGGNRINWDQSKDFSRIGAGGDFFMELTSTFDLSAAGSNNALGYGHSLGLVNAYPPGNLNGATVDLTCTVCHDPHGTDTDPGTDVMKPNVYRNLRVMYAPAGVDCFLCHEAPNDFRSSGFLRNMKSWVGGITGRYGDAGANYTPEFENGVAIWPVYRGDPTIPANNNVYDGYPEVTATVAVGKGMSAWCARCHQVWHENRNLANAQGEDWTRHPVNKAIVDAEVSGAGVDTIDFAHYSSIPDGFKVPAAYAGDPANIGNATYYNRTDGEYEVFCLSCHFAHAGPYRDGLRWNYLSSVSAGAQVGNPVPTNIGCQQCHKR